jgi:2-hydroxy-6-oxonona-2,4-dienedioate hydrolase
MASAPTRPRGWWVGLLAGGAVLGGLAVRRAFARDLAAARARLSGRPWVFASSAGALEYAVEGEGPPLLMIHGSGGGFDQGLAMARPLARAGHRVIAPSRFGYLGSDFPPDASPQAQADLFAALLDHLGIGRIAVCGASAGALSALQFALRHPTRCAALVLLVPAAWPPGRVPRAWGPVAEQAAMAVLGSDFGFWLMLKLSPGWLISTLLGTDPALVARAEESERRRVRDILWSILPVSARRVGVLNDTRLAGNPLPVAVEGVRAPSLILSAEDDRYGTAAAARDLASRIPGAELVLFASGGHVAVGHDAEMWGAIERFLRRVAPSSCRGG